MTGAAPVAIPATNADAFTYHYLPADELRAGDILPRVSRWPIMTVIVAPGSHVTVMMTSGYVKHYGYGGAEFGFSCESVKRLAGAS